MNNRPGSLVLPPTLLILEFITRRCQSPEGTAQLLAKLFIGKRTASGQLPVEAIRLILRFGEQCLLAILIDVW